MDEFDVDGNYSVVNGGVVFGIWDVVRVVGTAGCSGGWATANVDEIFIMDPFGFSWGIWNVSTLPYIF